MESAIYVETRPPCPKEIVGKPYPANYTPPILHKYDGITRNAREHIRQYIDALTAHSHDHELRLREFSKSLEGQAFTWYTSFAPGLVLSWNDLATQFMKKFFSLEERLMLSDLQHEKQRVSKGLLEYIRSFSLIEASNGGFSVDLIHRDSPNSPFYDPSETPSQRIAKALRHSINRVNHFKPTSSLSTNAAQADIISNQGEYLLKYSVGTPLVQILGIADTGSDLIWLQCKPCNGCYKQTAPLFDPTRSSTYKEVSCSSSQCQSLKGTSCSGSDDSSCSYSVSYGDQSFSNGDLAVDTLTLGSTTSRPVPLPKTIIGCGHNNGGTFNANGSGIVGLGSGAVSLVSQLDSSIDGKFSYCLIPLTSQGDTTSKLNFGSNAVVSGTTLTILPSELYPDFESVVKAEIDLAPTEDPSGVLRLCYESSSDDFKGPNITAHFTAADVNLSSSTTFIRVDEQVVCLAFVAASDEPGSISIFEFEFSKLATPSLPSELYPDFESVVKAEIDLAPTEDPSGVLRLCYESSSDDFKGPNITAHFTAADVNLSSSTTFIRVDEQVVCLAFVAASDEPGSISIFGNLAQANVLVGYDVVKKTMSFKPTDCTKL
nr:aspartic proteinase cdr1 [Quercus suber]